MARKLSGEQLQEFKAFLQTLYEVGQFPSDAEWARQSGVHAVNLSNARTGQGQTDGFNLLRLMQAAAEQADLPVDQLALLASRLHSPGRDLTPNLEGSLATINALMAEVRDRLATEPTSTVMDQVETVARRLHEAAEEASPEDLEGLELAARRLAEANSRVADSIAERRRGLGARR